MDHNNQADLGLILLKLQNSSIHDKILKGLSEFIENRPFNQTILFNSYSDVIDNHRVPILHLNQAKFFYGNIVALDLSSLYLSTKFINLNKIYFYATYIPWIEHIKPFSFWHRLFNIDTIEIISQNKQISDIFEIVWKKPICIAEEFDYEKLQHIL